MGSLPHPQLDGANITVASGGTGSVARALSSWASDEINVRFYGVKGDGVTDDTSAINAVATLASLLGVGLIFPAGVYMITSLSLPAVRLIRGAGKGVTILRRIAGTSAATLLAYTSKSGFDLRDLSLDGNKANQTVAGNNLVLTACSDFRVEVESYGAKSGAGIAIASGTGDEAAGTSSAIRNCRIHDNGAMGISARGAISNLLIADNAVWANSTHGISLDNTTFPTPSPGTIKRCCIRGNRVWSNGSNGIKIPGFATGGTSTAQVFGHGSDPANDCDILDNQVWKNAAYGIVAQFTGGTVADNLAADNGGTGSFYAGILVNGNKLRVARNRCLRNEYYGIDAGGSRDCTFEANECIDNGLNSTSGSGNGLNLGGCQNVTARGNRLATNGVSSGIQLSVARYEGAGVGSIGFPGDAGSVRLVDNVCVLSQLNHVGIKVAQDPLDIQVFDNRVYGAVTPYQAYILESTKMTVRNNWSDATIPAYNMNPASAVVIPDACERIILNASSNVMISGVRTKSVDNFINALLAIKVTAPGSGYTSAPTVEITGGGGTGATASAFINNDGTVVNVRVDTPGSGYTSAPTIALTGGGGTGATAVAETTMWGGLDTNVIDLLISAPGGNTLTFAPGTRTKLAGSVSFAATHQSTISFHGWSGVLYETARMVP